jgi:hypothetical protein
VHFPSIASGPRANAAALSYDYGYARKTDHSGGGRRAGASLARAGPVGEGLARATPAAALIDAVGHANARRT